MARAPAAAAALMQACMAPLLSRAVEAPKSRTASETSRRSEARQRDDARHHTLFPCAHLSRAAMSSTPSPLSVPFPPPTYVAGWHDEAAVRRMPYRRFGRERVVSQLTYGASALGGAFGTPGSAEEAKEILHTAIRSGINLIDVAPW